MDKIFHELVERLRRGEEAVLVTVISQRGSTPRKAGAKLLVRADQSVIGTIGGGAIEFQSIQEAYRVLEEKKSSTRQFRLTSDKAADLGMICGGEMEVLFQYVSPDRREILLFFETVLERQKEEKEQWMIVELDRLPELNMRVAEGDIGAKKTGVCEIDGKRCYVESFAKSGKVYIFGGGHVAQKLVPILSGVGFYCVVFDDREEFINDVVFPDARERIVGNFSQIEERVSVQTWDYVCIMTRGHQYDYEVQKQVMRRHPYYIGVMGSKIKTKMVSDKLEKDGFSREEIAACHAPIGLKIGARTPEEIAVSIAGELIAMRAKRMR